MAVAWKSIQSVRQEAISTEVLPLYFQYQREFASFQRQLNIYGFLRLNGQGPDQKAYYHELFLQGRPELCSLIPRNRIASNSVRRAFDPKTEPDFYSMVPLSAVTIASNRTTTPRMHVKGESRKGKAWAGAMPQNPMQQQPAIGLKTTGMTFADTASLASASNPSEVAGFDTSGFLFFDSRSTSTTNNRAHPHDISRAASFPDYTLPGLHPSLPRVYALNRTASLFGDPFLVQANMPAFQNAPRELIGFPSPANHHANPGSTHQTSITGVSQKMADRPTSTNKDPVVEEVSSKAFQEEHASKPIKKKRKKKRAASPAAPTAAAFAGIDDNSMSSLDMSETSGAEMADWLEDVDLETSTDSYG